MNGEGCGGPSADQDALFLAFEGNNWFRRNKAALDAFSPDTDLAIKLLDFYALRPRRVLEVGAANGFRVAAIAQRYGAVGVAVDASAEAIDDGRARFPGIRFVRGGASAIPLDEVFDTVIVNFLLHWVDRTTLMRVAAELDRLVADGGFLLVGDFHPCNLLRRPYHHLPGDVVYTYKQDYAEMFVASGLYHRIGVLTTAHGAKTLRPNAEEDDRVGMALLCKQLVSHYVDREPPRS